MLKKGSFITLIFVISTLIQLISQIVVTRIFGANVDLDIFLAAVAVPTILVTVIYGTLNDAFLPLYAGKKSKDESQADGYFMSHLIALTFLSFIIAALGGFFTHPLSELLYRGRSAAFITEVAIQMSYMLYSVPLSVIATVFGTYFYTHKQFIRFPLAQAIGSAANVGIILLLAPYFGIWALVIAFVANILIQIAFILPAPLFSFQFTRIDIVPLLLAWIPLIIGNIALRSDAVMIRSFGAHMPTGYLVYLNLISKIFALATGVTTIGIQVLLLPHLVEYMNAKEYEKAFKIINKSKLGAVGLSIFITILLMLFSPFIIRILFVGGKFTPHDADISISLLPLFVLPAIGWGVNNIFFQPLLAIRKQWTIACIHITALVCAWITGSLVLSQFGPLPAITSGLLVLLFGGIAGSEILWQYYKKKLSVSASSS
ncbi:MAG: integral rane protein MviN [Candidatus Parcubacteria bacterium]|jgi:putative peptidoglycan lipid II flippase